MFTHKKLCYLAYLSVFVVTLGTIVPYKLLPPNPKWNYPLVYLNMEKKKNPLNMEKQSDTGRADAFYLSNYIPVIRIYFLRYEKGENSGRETV